MPNVPNGGLLLCVSWGGVVGNDFRSFLFTNDKSLSMSKYFVVNVLKTDFANGNIICFSFSELQHPFLPPLLRVFFFFILFVGLPPIPALVGWDEAYVMAYITLTRTRSSSWADTFISSKILYIYCTKYIYKLNMEHVRMGDYRTRWKRGCGGGVEGGWVMQWLYIWNM